MRRGSHVLIGAAGEDYVLYELHRRGILAAQSPTNAYLADILVFDPEMSVGSMVQVKARSPGRRRWPMTVKHEKVAHPRLFYVFVDLGTSPPTSYVMPSAVVATVVARSHQTWLALPGSGGRVHRDSPIRQMASNYGFDVDGFPVGWMEEYRERWDLLVEEPDAVASPGGPDSP